MLQLLKVAGEVANLSADRMRKSFMGAVAVRRDGVLVYSRNGSTTPFMPTKTPSIHAEQRLLRKTGDGATIYVARLKRDGSFGMAKPCPRCMAGLKARRVEMVYYTISATEWEACKP